MRPVATGRPGTEVIPTGWAAAHQTPVEGTMTAARCSLRRPGTTTAWDEASQSTVTTPLPPYAADVPCRVQALNTAASDVQTAEQTITVAGYLVAVPADVAGVEVNDLVDITLSDDPDLTGAALQVDSVARGSHRFERDLFCTLS